MQQVPRIIHQIWSGITEPLPRPFKMLGETWKRDYPTWQYEFWDNERMNNFILEHYPQYWEVYNKYPFNVQRWDAIRYLILDKIGGMYVDFDYESLESLEEIIKGKTCCLAKEPDSHCEIYPYKIMFNNALMLNVPGHFFMQKIIEKIFSPEILEYDMTFKDNYVLNTTGPWMLINIYESLTQEEKDQIYLIPDKYVTPFDGNQALRFKEGERSEELENALKEAYAVHYFCGNWRQESIFPIIY